MRRRVSSAAPGGTTRSRKSTRLRPRRPMITTGDGHRIEVERDQGDLHREVPDAGRPPGPRHHVALAHQPDSERGGPLRWGGRASCDSDGECRREGSDPMKQPISEQGGRRRGTICTLPRRFPSGRPPPPAPPPTRLVSPEEDDRLAPGRTLAEPVSSKHSSRERAAQGRAPEPGGARPLGSELGPDRGRRGRRGRRPPPSCSARRAARELRRSCAEGADHQRVGGEVELEHIERWQLAGGQLRPERRSRVLCPTV